MGKVQVSFRQFRTDRLLLIILKLLAYSFPMEFTCHNPSFERLYREVAFCSFIHRTTGETQRKSEPEWIGNSCHSRMEKPSLYIKQIRHHFILPITCHLTCNNQSCVIEEQREPKY